MRKILFNPIQTGAGADSTRGIENYLADQL